MKIKKKYGSMWAVWKSHFAYVWDTEEATIDAVATAIKNAKTWDALVDDIWDIMKSPENEYEDDTIEEFLDHLHERYLKQIQY